MLDKIVKNITNNQIRLDDKALLALNKTFKRLLFQNKTKL